MAVLITCDHCRKKIEDQRKSFIFSVEKSGLHLNDASIEKVELKEETAYAHNQILYAVRHKREMILCSECGMELWNNINDFADYSKHIMERQGTTT